MSDAFPLPRAGAILAAEQSYEGEMLEPFVRDEHDDYWSVVASVGGETCPVQKYTNDGWVSAVFHRESRFLVVVAPGHEFTASDGRRLISTACKHHRGVRWSYADPPS